MISNITAHLSTDYHKMFHCHWLFHPNFNTNNKHKLWVKMSIALRGFIVIEEEKYSRSSWLSICLWCLEHLAPGPDRQKCPWSGFFLWPPFFLGYPSSSSSTFYFLRQNGKDDHNHCQHPKLIEQIQFNITVTLWQ